MTRKTLIFGNGLGMALDPDYFALDSAIGRTWQKNLLDKNQKKLICACLPGQEAERPHGEEDMDVLQLALSACDFLNGIGSGNAHWLAPHGQKFPTAVRKFFHDVAGSFHQSDHGLPVSFLDKLATFLHETRSHVATLNYDNLIYQPLIEREVLKGYKGALCDGFYNTGFRPENLERLYRRDFGYYLHLHGSPLFINRGDAIVKLRQRELPMAGDAISSHIVLTHVKHKPVVISASDLLATYWQLLLQALGESEEIVLIGYSGLDIHLNELLKASAPLKAVRVVEWEGAGPRGPRLQFWRNKLARLNISLVQLSSILDFPVE